MRQRRMRQYIDTVNSSDSEEEGGILHSTIQSGVSEAESLRKGQLKCFGAVIAVFLIYYIFSSPSSPTHQPDLTPDDFDADILIIGAGLSGSVLAHLHSVLLGKTSVIVEKRDHLGGNLYDFVNEVGIRTSKYGAHLFHTKEDRVWRFVQQFTDWTPYFHRVVGRVDGKIVPIPVNIDTVNELLGTKLKTVEEMQAWLEANQVHREHPQNGKEAAEKRVGTELYEKIFKDYTFKQWNRYPEDLAASVLERIPVRDDWDDRYFPLDPYQALPSHGYTPFMEKIIDNPMVKHHINLDFFDLKKKGLIDESRYEKIFFTGPIDAYFAHLGWPKLEYRSINFETIHLKNTDYYGPLSVVNNPQPPETFTRHVEYKHLFNQHGDHTTIVRERSRDDGDPYYPVPNKKNQDLYLKYQKMAQEEEETKHVYFVGRLASYKYFNMDQAILNAIENFERIYKGVNYDTEKMYGGWTMEAAKKVFDHNHDDPSVSVIIDVCHAEDLLQFISSSGCHHTRYFIYDNTKSCTKIRHMKELANCDITWKETSENSFLSFVLSQQWNFAEINVFFGDSGRLASLPKVVKKFKEKVQNYLPRENKRIDVMRTGHFQTLETCETTSESDAAYCDIFKKEFEQTECVKSTMRSWAATDAGLRRMLARHRTVLADSLRTASAQYFDFLTPYLFNGLKPCDA